MLVLSRQKDQVIMIGDDIEIHVVDIRGDKVRLGINAPNNIPVHRKEIYDAIKKENYAVYPVDMKAFYNSQGIKPITGRLEAGSIQNVLKQIRDVYIKEHPVVKKQEKPVARTAPMITPVNGNRNLRTPPKKLPPQKFTKKNVIRQTRGVRKQPRGR